jgi:hypothetical protein
MLRIRDKSVYVFCLLTRELTCKCDLNFAQSKQNAIQRSSRDRKRQKKACRTFRSSTCEFRASDRGREP